MAERPQDIKYEVDQFAKTLSVYMSQELKAAVLKGRKGEGNPQAGQEEYFRPEVTLTQGGYLVQIIALVDYWEFIEKGVDGTKLKHGSPFSYKKPGVKVKPIADWIEAQGIDAQKIVLEMRMKKRGGLSDLPKKELRKVKKQLSYESAVKALSNIFARSIARDGHEPKPYIDNAINRIDFNGFAERMSTLLGNAITIDLNLTGTETKINLNL